ncbi:AAA family ATPase [Paraburkholderia sp. RL18-103-BIB-C]|uniref:AAA family ATPase n=1 Tax=Paraburkholderia sp. RL18-103-BIB-C TaxID=3031637 RepID=UPI0038BE1C75
MAFSHFNSTGTGVILESAQDIVMESPNWLWPGWLSFGKVHLLAGPPSCGKSTLAANIGATISTGGHWPDGLVSQRGRVLVWSSEDRAEDTIVPRFVAAGADRNMIEVVRRVEESWMPRPFSPARDMVHLENKIRELRDVGLVIIDSIADLLSGSPGNNGKVRKDLLPLVQLAERTGAAVLGLAHVVKASKKKHPLERILGGVGLGAVVRIAMLVARDESGGFGTPGEWNVLVKAKSNLGRDDGGFLFRTAGFQLTEPKTGRLIDSSAIAWGGALPGTATAILHRAEGGETGGGRVHQAADFLMSTLRDGPVPFPDIAAAAAKAGISEATLRRAREQYGFGSEKQRGAGSASPRMWSMPAQGMSGSMIGGRSVADLGVSAPIVVPGYTPPFQVSATYPGTVPNGSGPAAHGGGFPSPQFASPRDAPAFAVPPQVEQNAQVEQVARVDQFALDADPVVAQFLGYAFPECQGLYRTLKRRGDNDGSEDELDFQERVIRQAVSGLDGLTKDQELALRDAILRANPW